MFAAPIAAITICRRGNTLGARFLLAATQSKVSACTAYRVIRGLPRLVFSREPNEAAQTHTRGIGTHHRFSNAAVVPCRDLITLCNVLKHAHIAFNVPSGVTGRAQLFEGSQRLVDLRSTGTKEQSQFRLRHAKIDHDRPQICFTLAFHGDGC